MAAVDVKTKLEIRKLAEKKILEGKTRQKAFEEIKEEMKYPDEEIAKIVRYCPSLQTREKYKGTNSLLGIILLLTVVVKIINFIPLVEKLKTPALLLLFGFAFFNLIIAISIFRFKGVYYRIIVVVTALGILNSLKYILGRPFDPFRILDYGMAAVLIGLGLYLMYKLVPNYEMKKVKYKSADGKIRIKEEIQFSDEHTTSDTLDGDMMN